MRLGSLLLRSDSDCCGESLGSTSLIRRLNQLAGVVTGSRLPRRNFLGQSPSNEA